MFYRISKLMLNPRQNFPNLIKSNRYEHIISIAYTYILYNFAEEYKQQTENIHNKLNYMKKFFMAALMAVCALTASAESDYYRIIPHVGIGYGNMSNTIFSYDGIDAKIDDGFGIVVGGEFEYLLTNRFGVSGGIDYMYYRSESEEIKNLTYGYESGEAYYTYSYLNIPVLAQCHFGKFALKAGLQPSINLAAKYHNNRYGDESVKGNFKPFSLALPIGVSYDFNSPITLDFRCAIPLTKQNKVNNAAGNVKFATVILSVGYRF